MSDLSLRPPVPVLVPPEFGTNETSQSPSKSSKSDEGPRKRPRNLISGGESDDDDNDEILGVKLPSFFHGLLLRLYLACDILELDTDTRFTALVLFHRYAYAITTHSMKPARSSKRNNHDHDDDNKNKPICDGGCDDGYDDWRWSAASCLFIACKAEEQHRRLRDIINVITVVLRDADENEEVVHGDDGDEKSNIHKTPLSSGSKEATATGVSLSSQPVATASIPNVGTSKVIDLNPPPSLDEDYWSWKQRLVRQEQSVLRWLKFDVLVCHPHRAVLWILSDQEERRKLQRNEDLPNLGDNVTAKSVKSLARVAFRRLNDGLFHVKALRHPTMVLACAAIQLALTDDEVPKKQPEGLSMNNSTSRPGDSPKFHSSTNSGKNTDGEKSIHTKQYSNQSVHDTQKEKSLDASSSSSTWWKRYNVRTVDLEDCVNDLSAATDWLRKQL